MSEGLQTALEGAWIVAVFFGLVFFVGAGPTRFLLAGEWRRYTLLLAPVVGWSLLVLELYVVNLAVGVHAGIYAVILVAAAINGLSLRVHRGEAADRAGREARYWQTDHIAPLIAMIGLLALGLIPHVVQGSPGLLSLNMDEETYYPATAYILDYSVIGGPHSLSETFLEGISLYGWAFQYTMAAVAAISGSLPFHVYLPATYCLLGLSVPAWHVFFREVYRLGPRPAALATLFYSLLGLPLWFAAYGYGPQMASLVAIPAGTAAFLVALKHGGMRRLALAGLFIAAGLTAYYRAIALQYVFTLAPVVLMETFRKPRLLPLTRTAVVVAIAFALGLPSHWHVGEHYLVQGAIREAQEIGENWSEGWGIRNFQPPSVAVGTQAYELVFDSRGTGPLAFLDAGFNLFSEPATWLILAVAAVGLWRARMAAPHAAAIAFGFGLYLAFDRFVLDFKYGYLKLLAVAGPLTYGFVVLACRDLWSAHASRFRPLGRFAARAGVSLFVLGAGAYLAYNSYQSYWFSASGWGLSMPSALVSGVHQMGQVVEPTARVFIAGRFQYPVPEERVQIRKNHVFGMSDLSDTKKVWARRVRGMAMAELFHADVYGWFDTHLIQGYQRLREDEAYDYYLLAPENDPRLEGLDAQDRVWSYEGLSLYRTKGVVRRSPWTLWQERGSLAITAAKPLQLQVAPDSLRTGEAASPPTGAKGLGRLRVGILAFARGEGLVQVGDQVQRLLLEPGLTWYTTASMPLPSTVTVRPAGGDTLGAVSLRLLDPGAEERDFVPASVIRDDLYASSSVLRLEQWLTDPFKGKGPGSL